MSRRHLAVMAVLVIVVSGCGQAPAATAVPPAASPSAASTSAAAPSSPASASATASTSSAPSATPTAVATAQATPAPTPSLRSIEELITGKQPATTAAQARAVVAAALKLPDAQSSPTSSDATANVKDCTSTSLPWGDRAAACYFAAKFAFGLYVATGDAAFYDTALRVHSYAVHSLLPDSVAWIDSRLRGQFV